MSTHEDDDHHDVRRRNLVPLLLEPLAMWKENPHFASVEAYWNIVFRNEHDKDNTNHHHPVLKLNHKFKRGHFIEDTLGQKMVQTLKSFDDVHAVVPSATKTGAAAAASSANNGMTSSSFSSSNDNNKKTDILTPSSSSSSSSSFQQQLLLRMQLDENEHELLKKEVGEVLIVDKQSFFDSYYGTYLLQIPKQQFSSSSSSSSTTTKEGNDGNEDMMGASTTSTPQVHHGGGEVCTYHIDGGKFIDTKQRQLKGYQVKPFEIQHATVAEEFVHYMNNKLT